MDQFLPDGSLPTDPGWREPNSSLQLPGCKIRGMIERGSHSTVYAGECEEDGEPVAIKTLSFTSELDAVQSLGRIQDVMDLEIQAVVPVLDYKREGTEVLIVTAFAAGGTLHDQIEDHGPLSWQESVAIAVELCKALAALHEADLCHGNITSDHVLMLGEEDWRWSEPHVFSDYGKTPYSPPERATEPLRATPAGDIFGLGTVLIEMLSGRPGNVLPEQPEWPAELATALTQMLAPEPQERCKDGASALALLTQVLWQADADKEAAKTPDRTDGEALPQPRHDSTDRVVRSATDARSSHSPKPPQYTHTAMMITSLLLGIAVLALLGQQSLSSAGTPAVDDSDDQNMEAAAANGGADNRATNQWHSPVRSVFALGGDRLATRAAEALLGQGLPLVERQRVDALLHEQDLTRAGRLDPHAVVRFGRMLGGHLALLYAHGDGKTITVRAVEVETGRILAVRQDMDGELATALSEALQAALPRLKAHGHARLDHASDSWRIDIGQHHALQAGDRVLVLDEEDLDSAVLAVGRVIDLQERSATIAVDQRLDGDRSYPVAKITRAGP